MAVADSGETVRCGIALASLCKEPAWPSVLQPSMAMLLVGTDWREQGLDGQRSGTMAVAGGPRRGDDRRVSTLWTRLCRGLGIEYPIWSVGMGMVAGPELAAAVSNAGGFGVLGTHDLSAKTIQSQVGRAARMEHLESQLAAADNSFDNPVLEPAARRPRSIMRYRRLGSSDLEVSEISLGSWLTFAGGVAWSRPAPAPTRRLRPASTSSTPPTSTAAARPSRPGGDPGWPPA